jgi:hypothetical protein
MPNYIKKTPTASKAKMQGGKLWHLDDVRLKKAAAERLAERLRHHGDECKHVVVQETKTGYEVWWTRG